MSREKPEIAECYVMFVRGFADGSACRPKRHPEWIAYVQGYKAGFDARASAVQKYCNEIGYKPKVLR